MFENRVFRANEALGGIIGFISSDQTPWSIYKKRGGKGRGGFCERPVDSWISY